MSAALAEAPNPVKADRIYVTFVDVARENMGYNGATFGGLRSARCAAMSACAGRGAGARRRCALCAANPANAQTPHSSRGQ